MPREALARLGVPTTSRRTSPCPTPHGGSSPGLVGRGSAVAAASSACCLATHRVHRPAWHRDAQSVAKVDLSDPAINTLFGAWAWAVAVFLAVRAATRRFAATAHRPIRDVRLAMAALAGIAITVVVAVVPVVTLNALAVLAMFGVPLAAVLGAVRATEHGRRRLWVRVLALATVVVGVMVLPIALVSAPGTVSVNVLDPDVTYAPMGRSTMASWDVIEAVSRDERPGSYSVRADVAPSISTWSEVRIEAWTCAESCREFGTVATERLVAADAHVRNGVLRAELPMPYRDVGWYLAVVVGIDDGGRREILIGPDSVNGFFVGSIVDWLQAPEVGHK